MADNSFSGGFGSNRKIAEKHKAAHFVISLLRAVLGDTRGCLVGDG